MRGSTWSHVVASTNPYPSPLPGEGGLRSLHHQICFTSASRLRQPRRVRKPVTACVVLLAALSCVRAQEQEKKLVDRLLKPDMTLHNDAQNKKFTADGSASINKRATVGAFYIHKKPNQKSYSATGQFSAQEYNSRTFNSGRSAFNTSSQHAMGNSRVAYATQTSNGTRDAPESDKKVPARGYGQTRPFLDEGKSQKSLNRQNAPLTIEQVRELLNKNK